MYMGDFYTFIFCACGGQNKSDQLDLELQRAVRYDMVTGN